MKNLQIIIIVLVFFYSSYSINAQTPNWLWANNPEGGAEIGYAIAADNNGNSVVAGIFGCPTLTFGTTVFTNSGSADPFLVNYDGSGNVLWANSSGGADFEFSSSVAFSKVDNVLVTGYFRSPTITFGVATLSNASGTKNK